MTAALLIAATLAACSTGSDDEDAERRERELAERNDREWAEAEKEYEAELREESRMDRDFQNQYTVENTLEHWQSLDHSDEPPDPRPGANRCLPSDKYTASAFFCGRVSRVVEVVDGDTLRLRNGQLVRLAGIDAPEVYPAVECGGREAKRFLTTLLTGRVGDRWNRLGPLPATVFLTPAAGHPDRDGFGRLLRLADVLGWRPNDEDPNRVVHMYDVGRFLVANGIVRFDDYAYANYATTPEDRKNLDHSLGGLRSIERGARAEGRGLWGSC